MYLSVGCDVVDHEQAMNSGLVELIWLVCATTAAAVAAAADT